MDLRGRLGPRDEGRRESVFLRREFTFDAAHCLERYHGKCEALHGHTYRFAVTLRGEPDDEGMVMDFGVLKGLVSERVLVRLDHSYLNDILPQPTAERIALWIWGELEPALETLRAELFEVQVWETASCSAIIHREDVREVRT